MPTTTMDGWMGSLVPCACGHGIEQHGDIGCTHASCACLRGHAQALDAAIDEVRTPSEIREQQQARYASYHSSGETRSPDE